MVLLLATSFGQNFGSISNFTHFAAIPTEAAEASSHVAICVTARGGHIGFLDGVWPKTSDEYMARLFGQYFSAALFDSDFSAIAERMLEAYSANTLATTN